MMQQRERIGAAAKPRNEMSKFPLSEEKIRVASTLNIVNQRPVAM
jgi:hypothetical protein